MRRQEEKDAELDQRIVALRKKNQALLRRYQVSRVWGRLEDPLILCPQLLSDVCLPGGLGSGLEQVSGPETRIGVGIVSLRLGWGLRHL